VTLTAAKSEARALVPPKDRRWRMLIGGELVAAVSGEIQESIDPATAEVIATFPSASAGDVDRAVAAAKKAFAEWSKTPPAQRAERVLALADAIDANGEELAVLDTLDNGTPLKVMRNDYRLAVEQLRYFAGLALHIRGDTIPAPNARSIDFTLRQPFGVVGRIVPFNHPFMFAAQKVAAPLIAGNTVVLKPALDTSLSALRLGELARDVLPMGALNVVTGPGSVVGERLVTHPDVPRLAFTGSVEVGQHLMRAANTAGVKTVTLELGGKNPCIVFADADVPKAVEGAIRGMNFTWQGQSCGSTSRLYIHRSLFDRVVGEIARRLDAMRVGDPFDPATEVGAIVSQRQFEKVVSYLKAGPQERGVKLLAGGRAESIGRGWFVRPTLFTVEHEAASTVACEEIFGPVLVAMAFDTYEDVIARANALPVGLTGSVWTKDLGTAMRAVHDLDCGYVWVNASSSHIAGAPFGGRKQSGIGSDEGIEELLSYTQLKNVFIQYD
jgi:acyl-CoA reductase-like NAD-dependent aldehyde dehydrogenase